MTPPHEHRVPAGRPPRVLHVNTYDMEGGAARAAHRIHVALRAAGVDSELLVSARREPRPYVIQPFSPAREAVRRVGLAASGLLAARQRTPGNPTLHSLNLFPSGLADWINRSDFDLVNLHWVADELLSIAEIGRIDKPVCWTMHDMWPFCGAEHYDDLQHPDRYRAGYTAANRPPTHAGPDLDARTWQRKRKAWAGRRFQLVSPSRWLADCARHSALLGGQSCTVIPNCVDTALFKPLDQGFARAALGLAADRKYVLFGAIGSMQDPRKGFDLLRAALLEMAAQPEAAARVELLVFGAHAPVSPPELGFPIRFLGTFRDDVSLALVYNAADVFVAPSMQDNLPNTIVESLACGTPCAAFRIGGMPDLIEHGGNGWLAEPFEAADLSRGIRHLLQRPRTGGALARPGLCENAGTAASYRQLYEQMLQA